MDKLKFIDLELWKDPRRLLVCFIKLAIKEIDEYLEILVLFIFAAVAMSLPAIADLNTAKDINDYSARLIGTFLGYAFLIKILRFPFKYIL